MKNRANFFLLAAIFALTVLFLLSFFKNKNPQKNEISSALVNPKYKADICAFELSSEGERLTLQKMEGVWICKNDKNALVCNGEKADLFIENLIKVIKVYEILYKTDAKSYGFGTENEFKIRFFTDEFAFHDIFIGNVTFSGRSRYFMGEKNSRIYEAETNLWNFLTVSPSFWAEPFMIPRALSTSASVSDFQRVIFNDETGKSVVTRENDLFFELTNALFEMRHGGIGDKAKITSQNHDLELVVEMGDTSSCVLRFFPVESGVQVEGTYIFPLGSNKKNIDYNMKISKWTYNQLNEIKRKMRKA